MELKEGMYVRTLTLSGISRIGKLEKIDDICITDNGAIDKTQIIKASNNIIDLIEVGDYVNGYLIEEFYDTYNPETEEYEDILGIAIYDDARMDCIEEIRPLRTLEIKSIVTKEQFESISYKVGE